MSVVLCCVGSSTWHCEGKDLAAPSADVEVEEQIIPPRLYIQARQVLFDVKSEGVASHPRGIHHHHTRCNATPSLKGDIESRSHNLNGDVGRHQTQQILGHIEPLELGDVVGARGWESVASECFLECGEKERDCGGYDGEEAAAGL